MERTLALARADAARARPATAQVLRDLLALRSDDPSAARTLARLVGEQECFLEGVRAGYRYVEQHAGDEHSPLRWHQGMRARDHVSLSGLGAGHGSRRIRASGTPRDVVGFNGYRLAHALAVACEVVHLIDPQFRAPEHVPAWRSVFVSANYALVLAADLGCWEDDAFGGAFLAGTGALLVAARRGEPGTRADALEAARALAAAWALPDGVTEAFARGGVEGSLADLVDRAAGTAARHGFDDPLGLAPDLDRAPAVEPTLDGYLDECGGVAGVSSGVGAMMAIALITVE
jgi:hypothetical protein